MTFERASRGNRCWFTRLAHQLDTDKVQAVIKALEDPLIEGSAIARALKDWGFQVNAHSVTYHRRGDCACH